MLTSLAFAAAAAAAASPPAPPAAAATTIAIDWTEPPTAAAVAIPTYLDQVNPSMDRESPIHDAVFSRIDKLGAKLTVLIGVFGICIVGVPLLLIETKLWFYILGSCIGLFFGPVQSAARSLMARMAPPGMETEMFGLFAFSGKATAFLGPLIAAYVINQTGSQHWGIATVLPFIFVGGILLIFVKTEKIDRDSVAG